MTAKGRMPAGVRLFLLADRLFVMSDLMCMHFLKLRITRLCRNVGTAFFHHKRLCRHFDTTSCLKLFHLGRSLFSFFHDRSQRMPVAFDVCQECLG
ncbi:hypothetical protein EVD32_13025 [Bacteroidales bacterium SW299]|nr:hypothetical protein [Bacteroidales bacterium SW299]